MSDFPDIESRDAFSLDFSDAEAERYSRHILLPRIGPRGQARLRASSVLVIGAGGLGSPSLLYLAAAGVGRIVVVDHDRVDLSNLQRQVAHSHTSIGSPKAESARDAMLAINPEVDVVAINEPINVDNARELVSSVDLVLDGCDNFATRYLVNDACFFEGKPLISASVFRFEGQLISFPGGEGDPCYRCVFPSPPPPGTVPSCSEAGVLGAVVGTLGTMQATEAIKFLAGMELASAGKLFRYDALSLSLDGFATARNRSCALCGENPTITELSLIDIESCELG